MWAILGSGRHGLQISPLRGTKGAMNRALTPAFSTARNGLQSRAWFAYYWRFS